MAYAIGTLLRDGANDAHYLLLDVIESTCHTAGWVTLDKVENATNKYIILKSQGLSGSEEIYIGVLAYQNAAADYYNYVVSPFTGYVPGNHFDNQPGASFNSLPAHNNSITYYITANAQRLILGLKVGTPIYSHAYVGKFYPYAMPTQYPYPVVSAGVWAGNKVSKRFSDSNAKFPYHGAQINGPTDTLSIRKVSGEYYKPSVAPFSSGTSSSTSLATSNYCLVPNGSRYALFPLVLHDNTRNTVRDVYGELDGVKFCSGFNNNSENVIQAGGSAQVDVTGMTPEDAVDAIKGVGGKAYVMLQNIWRTAWYDFVAIEME
jgi:hypothetical protein